MGKPDKARSDKTLAVTVGADGNVNYDAIVKQGKNKDKYIASTHDAMVPKVDRLKDGVRAAILADAIRTQQNHFTTLCPITAAHVLPFAPCKVSFSAHRCAEISANQRKWLEVACVRFVCV